MFDKVAELVGKLATSEAENARLRRRLTAARNLARACNRERRRMLPFVELNASCLLCGYKAVLREFVANTHVGKMGLLCPKCKASHRVTIDYWGWV